MANGLIHVHEDNGQFHLTNGLISYIIGIEAGKPLNLYAGRAIADKSDFSYLIDRHFRVLTTTYEEDGNLRPELVRMEYPEYGRGDFREPALTVLQADGSRVTDLKYVGYRVLPGKPELEALPSTRADSADVAETLQIRLLDELIGLQVTLNYTIFTNEAVIARSVLVENLGSQSLTIERAASLNLDLPDSDYTMTEFVGAWAREREPHSQPLHPGMQAIGSTRGASSPNFNPTAIIARPDTNEQDGEAWGLAFVYSGNFDLHAEVDSYQATRLQLGINPLGFSWHLAPGEHFQTPEALLGHTTHGLNDLSHTFHRIVLDHLQRPQWRRRERPILINNWEATYFDFTEDKLLELARTAKAQGIELFVLDDGWFGSRTSDRSGLGDWVANPDRLPEGVAGIARKINDIGMQFGLWFEPEMANTDSDVVRAHPDWVISAPGRGQSMYRHQHVLNFANQAVVDSVYGQMHAILDSANVAYIKWDMNRFITEAFDATRGLERQGEMLHRYILGVYELYRRLLEAFPNLIIEGCSSGGARFDMGILAYSPQIWTSDDTDAIERLHVQYGTSYFYPVAAMGAHVSITPNHQTGRCEPIDTRANVAMFGTFGYEMDLNHVPQSDLAAIRRQTAFFKTFAPLIHNGDFYRLAAPAGNRKTAWMSVAADRSQALVADFCILGVPNRPLSRLHMQGLDPERWYEVRYRDANEPVEAAQSSAGDAVDAGSVAGDAGASAGAGAGIADTAGVAAALAGFHMLPGVYSGAELMHVGLDDTDLFGRDFNSRLYFVSEQGTVAAE
ncbi:alpha-galactosidase [Bifidobacterium oedipodis]|uniref:alpha-galactosidase n=1 Tax=Bifidobacterium oedipodis TaxID=2675322 RepID=A0A7Y0HUC0_9BIFI|nr:alpha-galactosidase [Bifidobacterium sp. DSM 109957]NMM94594.1 alpha-galactosidase [Bifidobacterium sp. DSM 109957]